MAQTYLGFLELCPVKKEALTESLLKDCDQVRVAFVSDGTGWKALPSNLTQEELQTIPAAYPKNVSWHLVASGKILGQLQSSNPDKLSGYSSAGKHNIALKEVPVSVINLAQQTTFNSWVIQKLPLPVVAV